MRIVATGIIKASVIALACLYVVTPQVVAQQADLENIQQQIAAAQKQKAAREAKRDEILDTLQSQEKKISNIAKELNQINLAIIQNNAQIKTFEREIAALKHALAIQRNHLGQQIRSAFVAGDYDLAKMIFNQEDIAELERMLTYYQYIYKDRKTAIDEFRQGIARIQKVEQALEVEQKRTMRLSARLEGQSIELASEQFARQKSLDALQAQIDSDIARIERLQIDEQRLTQAIAEATRKQTLTESLVGLANFKGGLTIPADGVVHYHFGKRREGQLKWKGVVINGDSGSSITSVANGKVLFADWLRGFGLVLVVDHGAGYMTVYGHNQALLKSVGDLVNRGETIALMGQSGGQSTPNLYFELRHKGIPLNPKQWFAR